jgi:hypothetical protein
MPQMPTGLERVDHAALLDTERQSNKSPNQEREDEDIEEFFAQEVQLWSEEHKQALKNPRPPQMAPREPHLVVDLDSPRIEHYNFVGECLLSYWRFPEAPIPTEFINSHKQIIVLH